MSDDYRSIKVPAWAYDNAQLILSDLARRGTDSIPAALRTPAIDKALQSGPTLSAILALGLESLRQATATTKTASKRRASSKRP